MYRKLFLLLFLIVAFIAQAQILTPAKWKHGVCNENPKVGNEIELVFKTTIDKNWYLYSTEFPCEEGPMKTEFSFEANPGYKLIGNVVAVNPTDKHDKIFDCDVKIFKDKAQFRQKIKVLTASLKITGTYSYQVCTEVTGQCVPGDGEFSFDKIKVNSSPQS